MTKIGHRSSSGSRLRFGMLLTMNILVICSFCVALLNQRRSRDIMILQNNQRLDSQIKGILDVYGDTAKMLFDIKVNTPKIKNILQRAYYPDSPEGKNLAREELLSNLDDFYQTIGKYHFQQFHFHSPENTSFLRFLLPEKYGDDLSRIRYSVNKANTFGIPIAGFEEGRFFNGYRFVFPINQDSLDLGSVELSIPMKTLIDQLEQLYDIQAQFIMENESMERDIWRNDYDNYSLWDVDPRFVLEDEITEQSLFEHEISKKTYEQLQQSITENQSSGTSFSEIIKIYGEKAIASFMPINNIMGETVGWVFILGDYSDIALQNKRFLGFIFLLSLLYFILLLFTIYYRSSQKKLEKLASLDNLTGVFNRSMLFQLLHMQEEFFKRYDTSYSVIMIDIDYFKRVNDDFGHQAGDRVLSMMSEVLKTQIRSSDIVGRYGGEEFLIILPEIDQNGAFQVAEKLREMVEQTDFSIDRSVTISCGVAQKKSPEVSPEELVNQADRLLYQAKNQGRNRVCFEEDL
ncbi:MAG: diguanylate cyclase [Spirochaetaceae bacterium]|jgi:diguanylate cyclase (GGDEF)-like protein|nr:diguanylate cyclase [Spirochaetaceae bacterium]